MVLSENKILMKLLALHPVFQKNYGFLLVTLVVVLLVFPVFARFQYVRIIIDMFVTFSLLVAWVTTCSTTRQLRAGFILVAINLTARTISYLEPSFIASALSMSTSLLFYPFVAILLIRDVLFGYERVSANLYYGALSVYLLIGVSGAFLFGLLELFFPGSFLHGADPITSAFGGEIMNGELFYFSLVTMTTLGYGDIAPNSLFAGIISSFLAICGQIYVALVIARLVGLEIAQARSR